MQVFRARLISGGGKKAQVVVHRKDDDGITRSATRHVVRQAGSDRFVGTYPDDDVLAINRALNEAAKHNVGVTNSTLAFLKSSIDKLREQKAKAIEASKNQDILTASMTRFASSLVKERIANLQELVKLAEAELEERKLTLAKMEKEHPYPLYAEFEIN